MASPAESRLAPPADPISPTEAAAPAGPLPCPRCGGPLTNPDGLGWCRACGYCRSLEESVPPVAAPAEAPSAPRKPSALGASEFADALRRMPDWVWPLLAGAATVVGASLVADHVLPQECFARALWSALQVLLSLVGLIAAQIWTVLLVAADEDWVGMKDVVLPGRLWRAAFRRLPATRAPVWLGAWCLAGLLCGAAVVGGFNYWLEAIQKKRPAPAGQVGWAAPRAPLTPPRVFRESPPPTASATRPRA